MRLCRRIGPAAIIVAGLAVVPIAAHAQVDADGTAGGWQVGYKVDKLDGTKTFQAETLAKTDRYQFKITAICDFGKFHLSFTVFAREKSAEKPSYNRPDGESWEWLKTRTEAAGVSQMRADFDFSNNARVTFDFPGEAQAFARAKAWRIKLPLTDSESPVIAIEPQSASFQPFLAQCIGSEVRNRSAAQAEAKRAASATFARAPIMQLSNRWQVTGMQRELNGLDSSDPTDQSLTLHGGEYVKVLETRKEETYGYVWSRVVAIDRNGTPKRTVDGRLIEGWERTDQLGPPN